MEIFYGKVFKALNKAKVKYVVAGGTAVILYGYPRFTKDLDLIVFLEDRNLEKLFETLQSIGFFPKVPVTKEQFKDKKQRALWKKEKGMIVFSFVEREPPFKLIDMFVDEPFPFDEIYKKRVQIKVDGITVPVINIDQLKKLKKIAGRPQDLIDLVQLGAIQRMRS
jgi:predicted nucleotidyltransferase